MVSILNIGARNFKKITNIKHRGEKIKSQFTKRFAQFAVKDQAEILLINQSISLLIYSRNT
jgi:hypothetical protein